jgi:predicted HTH domain antitoxin
MRQLNQQIYQELEESNRFEQLLFRALIENQISMSKAASLANRTLAEFKKEYQPMF